MKKPTENAPSDALVGSLFSAEHSLDAAMTEAAELMAALLKARKDGSLAPSNLASVKLGEALEALTEARAAMVEAHSELNFLKREVSGQATPRLGRSPLTGQFVLKPAGRTNATKSTKVREVTEKIAASRDS